MEKQVTGTSQWRKIIQTKQYSDKYGYIWKFSTWKIAGLLLFILVLLILLYSFFVPNQAGYFADVLFYAIITIAIVLIIWIACNFIWKARAFFVGFIIGLILIFVFYAGMGFALSFIGWNFHYGFTTWLVITCLAMLGAKRIDGNLDKSDVFFGLLVFLVLVGGNMPVFGEGMGFFTRVDEFVTQAMNIISKIIHPEDFLSS